MSLPILVVELVSIVDENPARSKIRTVIPS